MKQSQLRIEIIGRDQFWQKAVIVEWEDQFPDRKLVTDSHGFFLIEAAWHGDLERVAKECFSRILIAPADPGRRGLFKWLLPEGKGGKRD